MAMSRHRRPIAGSRVEQDPDNQQSSRPANGRLAIPDLGWAVGVWEIRRVFGARFARQRNGGQLPPMAPWLWTEAGRRGRDAVAYR